MSLALQTAQRNIQAGCEFLGMNPAAQEEFSQPQVPPYHLRLNIAHTSAADYTDVPYLDGWIDKHNMVLGRPRGGQTALGSVTVHSVMANGAAMVKNTLDPDRYYQYGFGKSGINTGEKIPKILRDRDVSLERKLEIIEPIAYAFVGEALAAGAISPDVTDTDYTYAPDRGTNTLWMDAGVRAMQQHTGKFVPALNASKSEGMGGLPGTTRTEATGYGLIRDVRNRLLTDPELANKIASGQRIRLAMSGFGNVASYAYEILQMQGMTDDMLAQCDVISLADATGSYYNQNGLRLMDFKTLRGLEDVEGSQMSLEFAVQGEHQRTKDPRDTLKVECEMLITASTPNLIYTEEDRKAFPEDTRYGIDVHELQTSRVEDGGNNSVTYAAQQHIRHFGPGIRANGGGSVVSWDEINYGLRLMSDPAAIPPTLEESRRNLDVVMDRRFNAIAEFATANGVDEATAAHAMAVGHILAAA